MTNTISNTLFDKRNLTIAVAVTSSAGSGYLGYLCLQYLARRRRGNRLREISESDHTIHAEALLQRHLGDMGIPKQDISGFLRGLEAQPIVDRINSKASGQSACDKVTNYIKRWWANSLLKRACCCKTRTSSDEEASDSESQDDSPDLLPQPALGSPRPVMERLLRGQNDSADSDDEKIDCTTSIAPPRSSDSSTNAEPQ